MGEDAAGDAQQVAEAMYNGGRLRPAGVIHAACHHHHHHHHHHHGQNP
jgi:hypothetical protein